MKSSTLLMVLVFVFTAGLASAQGKVEWGDLEKSTGRLIDVIPDQGENFYILQDGTAKVHDIGFGEVSTYNGVCFLCCELKLFTSLF